MEIFPFIGVHEGQTMQKVVCIIQEDGIYQYLEYLLVMHQLDFGTLS